MADRLILSSGSIIRAILVGRVNPWVAAYTFETILANVDTIRGAA